MIKRIKGSLFAKVFILTVAVLLCVSFLVYGVLAWYMPQTYSNNLNAALDEQTSDFIYELEHIRMQDSGGLFDQFLQNTTISMVELYTADGVLVETPSNQNDFNDGITGEALGGTSYESAPIISNSYYFSFADDNSQYILTVYGEASQIAELRQSFVSVLPILFCVILLVSLATAWVYSRIITNPVLKISRISKEMSDMRLEWQLEERRSDELGVLENSLNTLSRKLSATLEELQSANLQLQKDIEHQKALERAQQDFFSSASHELKTPLTSICNYVDLMSQLETLAPQEAREYLGVLQRQSARLKKLTEDLIEASKASSGVIPVHLAPTNLVELLRQATGEYDQRLAQGNLKLCAALPEQCSILADGRLLWRVLDNLLSNCCKYAMPGTRVYLTVTAGESKAALCLKNVSREMLTVDPAQLTERFVRADASRSSEGSGLGLNIARSLTELQHGKFSISTDGDLFKAEIRLPLAQ